MSPIFFANPRLWHIGGSLDCRDWIKVASFAGSDPILYRKMRERYKQSTSPQSFIRLAASLDELVEDTRCELFSLDSGRDYELTELTALEAARAMREEGENLIRDWVRQRRLGMSEAESEQQEILLTRIIVRWRELQANADEIELRNDKLKRLNEQNQFVYRLHLEAEMIARGAESLQPDIKATQE